MVRSSAPLKVTRLLSGGRNVRGKHLAAFFTSPLFRPEEEHAVLNDWTTEVAAEVVVFQLRFRLARAIQEEVVGVESSRF